MSLIPKGMFKVKKCVQHAQFCLLVASVLSSLVNISAQARRERSEMDIVLENTLCLLLPRIRSQNEVAVCPLNPIDQWFHFNLHTA